MFELEKQVRKNILELTPYSCARDEFKGEAEVFLDANENPFGELNRYPDPYQIAIKEKLSEIKRVPIDNIFIGNGSDEIIDLSLKVFCNPGYDKALTFSPTYGMYDVSSKINDVELLKVELTSDFQIDLVAAKDILKESCLKLIFICSPNNPTGNLINDDSIKFILEKFKGIVIIDEAYFDFSNTTSWSQKLAHYPNLIVMQTLSKAWGLAACRIGMAFSSSSIINLFNKVKPPYNVSQPAQWAAQKALGNPQLFESNRALILKQKALLESQLSQLSIVEKVYPSNANFLLVKVTDANSVYNELLSQNVITRNRNKIIDNCIRITVGTATENQQLLKVLKNIKS